MLPEFSGLVAQLGLSYTLLGVDDVRRQLLARPDLLLRGAAAVLHQQLGRRLGPPRARAAASTCWSRPIGIEYAYEDLLTQPAGAVVTSARTPAASTRPGTTRGSLGYRIGKRPRRLRRRPTGSASRPRETFRDYDNLRFGTTVTYGF